MEMIKSWAITLLSRCNSRYY